MLPKMTTTKTASITKRSTTIIPLNRPPSTTCGGYIDIHGIWNNGFACPIQNFVQYYCCGTDNDHYCCSPDRYLSEINSSTDPIYISGQYSPSNNIINDYSNNELLIKKSNIINKQFEEFQKLFLPIFLLTSSILFLIGIAIWFWLYKHKAFYAIGQDDLNERNSMGRKTSTQPIIRHNSLANRKDSINLTLEKQSRRISHPSTEV